MKVQWLILRSVTKFCIICSRSHGKCDKEISRFLYSSKRSPFNLTFMKKTFFLLTIGFTLSLVSGDCIYAQNSQKHIEPEMKPDFMPSIHNLSMLQNHDLSGVSLLARNEINISAVRDFVNRFDEVNNALWFAIPKGGYEAYFVRDGYGDRVIYDKSGGWLMSLITYNEDKCPRDIRAAVKSLFFDFDIILIEEVHNRDGVEFIFYLQDKSSIQIVRVTRENEVEILHTFDRQSY